MTVHVKEFIFSDDNTVKGSLVSVSSLFLFLCSTCPAMSNKKISNWQIMKDELKVEAPGVFLF